MLHKELIDRPALPSSDPPVNPRFAKPKDPSLLPPQPKRQVGTHMSNTDKHTIPLTAGNSILLCNYRKYLKHYLNLICRVNRYIYLRTVKTPLKFKVILHLLDQ